MLMIFFHLLGSLFLFFCFLSKTYESRQPPSPQPSPSSTLEDESLPDRERLFSVPTPQCLASSTSQPPTSLLPPPLPTPPVQDFDVSLFNSYLEYSRLSLIQTSIYMLIYSTRTHFSCPFS